MLTFDETTHTYRLDGRKIPSVTTIIKAAGLIDDIWFNEAATWRGSVVHKCCELDCKGKLDESTVDPGAAGYLEGWRKWKRETGFRPVVVEQMDYHSDLFYAGTPDRVGFVCQGEPCVVDIKTGPAQKWHAIQLAAYRMFLGQAGNSYRRFGISVHVNGTYTQTEYTVQALPVDWAAFLSCQNIFNWRKINGY